MNDSGTPNHYKRWYNFRNLYSSLLNEQNQIQPSRHLPDVSHAWSTNAAAMHILVQESNKE